MFKKRLFLGPLLWCMIGNAYEGTNSQIEIESKLQRNFFSPEIASLNISDWQNPTAEDYWNIHCFTKQRHIANINIYEAFQASGGGPFSSEYLNSAFYGVMLYRSGRIGITNNPVEMPLGKQVEYFGNDPNKREKCIICYAGYSSRWNGRNYLQGINAIITSLRISGFDGHFIYYIGGWPGLKRDRLKWVDSPFAFKPFLFEEVKDLGYENVLWLDACCIPVKNVDQIFELIRENGLCFYSYGSMVQWGGNQEGYKHLLPFLELSKDKSYEEISTQVVGLNMKNSAAMKLLNEWIKAAEQRIPFLASDEPPFMYLVNYLGLNYGRMPSSFYIETPCNTGNFEYWKLNNRAIIYHQYDFIDTQYPVPDIFFNHIKSSSQRIGDG